MDVSDTLEMLRKKAYKDPDLRRKLIATHKHPDALSAFCAVSTEAGFPLYAMDVIESGESAYAAMKRSTNGGGENSPALAYEDDLYEMLIEELKEYDKRELPH
jgi:hypothetical protein